MKRGGLCFVGSQRHVKANNHYLDDYDETKPEIYLTYWDAYNLYGWAMMQLLASKNLKFNTTINLEDILKTEDDNQIGYYVECDFEYPEELHDKFKEFPPCPETIIPKEEWLSDFQKDIIKQNKMKHSNCPKLIPHLMKHKKYVIHYRNLEFDTTITLEDSLNTSDKSKLGYYVECDLEYPEDLHDKFKEYPPCPESLTPKEEWISDFQKDMTQQKMKPSSCPKLIPHLMKHEQYVIHYRNLKYINKLGVKITELHRVMEFEQKAWLTPYIDMSTKSRTFAKHYFENDF